jgi:hypothetical protein
MFPCIIFVNKHGYIEKPAGYDIDLPELPQADLAYTEGLIDKIILHGLVRMSGIMEDTVDAKTIIIATKTAIDAGKYITGRRILESKHAPTVYDDLDFLDSPSEIQTALVEETVTKLELPNGR